MGAGKIVEVSAESILSLLHPFQNDAALLSTSPVVNLLSQHIEHVTSNDTLNKILLDSVQGILRSTDAASSTGNLVKVIEQASLTLLDKTNDKMSEKELETEKGKHEKTLAFVRGCFHTCLDMILNSKDDLKGDKNNYKA